MRSEGKTWSKPVVVVSPSHVRNSSSP